LGACEKGQGEKGSGRNRPEDALEVCHDQNSLYQ
jgi:hypothetical protein